MQWERTKHIYIRYIRESLRNFETLYTLEARALGRLVIQYSYIPESREERREEMASLQACLAAGLALGAAASGHPACRPLETYQAGLAKDPENEELKDGLRRTMIEIQRGQTGQVDEAEMKQRQERAMQDPEIQNILSDPVMRQVLNDMSTDPRAAAEHQKNPMVMAKIQKLINAGIVQTR